LIKRSALQHRNQVQLWELPEDRLQDVFEIDANLHIVRQSDDPNVLELTGGIAHFYGRSQLERMTAF
jgi:hypothetical protein